MCRDAEIAEAGPGLFAAERQVMLSTVGVPAGARRTPTGGI